MKLFSLLISLAISSVLLVTPITFLDRIQQLYLKTQHARARELLRSHLTLQLLRTAADLDLSRHAAEVVISDAATLTNYDGTPSELLSASPNLRPLLGSDALTSIRVSPSNGLRVELATESVAGIAFLGCFFAQSLAPSVMDRGFAGIRSDAVVGFTARPKRRVGRPGCFDLLGTTFSTPTLRSASTTTELRTVRLLIPILHEYTLYLSRGHELRLVSYKNGRIVENQPILKSIASLRFQIRELIPEGPVVIEAASAILNSRRSIGASVTTLTTPASTLNLLTNVTK